MSPLSPEQKLPDWESPDVSVLRAFLESAVGKKFVTTVAAARPPLGGATMEEAAMRAKMAEGFESCMSSIFSLAFPPRIDETNIQRSTTYPPLEDESAWETK